VQQHEDFCMRVSLKAAALAEKERRWQRLWQTRKDKRGSINAWEEQQKEIDIVNQRTADILGVWIRQRTWTPEPRDGQVFLSEYLWWQNVLNKGALPLGASAVKLEEKEAVHTEQQAPEEKKRRKTRRGTSRRGKRGRKDEEDTEKGTRI
jgi:hypothetical protein